MAENIIIPMFGENRTPNSPQNPIPSMFGAKLDAKVKDYFAMLETALISLAIAMQRVYLFSMAPQMNS